MNQFKQQFLVLLFFTAPLITFAQVGIGTTDPKAALDVVSTDTGFIMPRVSDHTTLSVGVDQIGMQVYNTTTNSIWFYDGTGWEAISGETQAAVSLWKSSTNDGDYEENDVINYNGVLYKNLTGTNSDDAPDSDIINWMPLSEEQSTLVYENKEYTIGNTVGYLGTMYVSKQNITAPEFPQFSKTTTYSTGDKVFYEGVIRVAEENITIPTNYPYETSVFSFPNAGWSSFTFRIDPNSNYGFASVQSWNSFKIRTTPSISTVKVKIFNSSTGNEIANRTATNVESLGDKWYRFTMPSYSLTGNESIGFYIPSGNQIYLDNVNGFDLFYASGDVTATTNTQTDRKLAFEILASTNEEGAAFDESQWGTQTFLPTENWRVFKEGQNAVPLWDSSTNGAIYIANDIVNYNGILYKNLTGTNSDTTPDLDSTNWVISGGSGGGHADTSSQDSVNYSGGTLIQDITLDGNGHVTGIGAKTIKSPQAWSFSITNLTSGYGTQVAVLPYNIKIFVNSSRQIYLTTTDTRFSGSESWGYASFEYRYSSSSRGTGVLVTNQYTYAGSLSRYQPVTITIIPPGNHGFSFHNRITISCSHDYAAGFILATN